MPQAAVRIDARAGEAVAAGGAGDVDKLDIAEKLDGDVLSDFVVGDVIHADFGDVATWRHSGFCEVAALWLVYFTGVNIAIGDLDGAVAILFFGANLGHDARPCFDDGDRHNAVVFVEDLGHAELGAQNALDLIFTH